MSLELVKRNNKPTTTTGRASGMIVRSQQRFSLWLMQSLLRVFAVAKPTTVFVRGSKCRIKVHYHDLNQVEIHANLFYAFGLRFVTEQDDAGVYIVIKRRRLLGMFSKAEFVLNVPRYANLALSLTPGSVHFEDVSGILEIPPVKDEVPPTFEQFGTGQ